MSPAPGPVRIGLAGVGAVAQVAHLPAYRRLRNATLVALCDDEPTKLRTLAERTAVRHAVPTLDDLLALDDVDAVDVCLPSHLHADAVVRCLEAGKHVLCEKPLGLSSEEVARVAGAAERTDRVVLVGMNNRFRDDSILLKHFIEDGALGELFYVRSGWLKRRDNLKRGAWQFRRALAGGGVVMDLGVHLLDLSLWLTGYPRPQRVSASFFYHTPDVDVEDSAVISVTCESGLTLTVEASWRFMLDADHHFLNVFGLTGSGLLNPAQVFQRLDGDLVNITPHVQEPMKNVYMASYEREIAFFAEVAAGRAEAPALGEQLVLAQTIDAIQRSATEGREVRLDETAGPSESL